MDAAVDNSGRKYSAAEMERMMKSARGFVEGDGQENELEDGDTVANFRRC
jgi:hypothetical protein